MISIKPKWVAKILNGEKTIEIRKTFPSDYVGWVYIYMCQDHKRDWYYCKELGCYSKDIHDHNVSFEAFKDLRPLNGKVVARFWCDKVGNVHLVAASLRSKRVTDWNCDEIFAFEEHACLTQEDLDKYLGSVAHCPQGKAIHIAKVDPFDKPKEISEFYAYGDKKLKLNYHQEARWLTSLNRAPQSWCYVEV